MGRVSGAKVRPQDRAFWRLNPTEDQLPHRPEHPSDPMRPDHCTRRPDDPTERRPAGLQVMEASITEA